MISTFISINAQDSGITGKVEYNYQINPSEVTRANTKNSILLFTDKESLYEIDYMGSLSENKPNDSFNIPSKENDFVYKDFISNVIFFTNNIEFKKFIIKEPLNFMSWDLTSNTKEILGYQCQDATTTYGGRFYIAYYTPEIPISNGPWRFSGLPGLILKVHSIDGVFELTATSLKITQEPIAIENPFQDKKYMTWKEFLTLYKKKYDEVLRNNMTEYGPSQMLAKKGIVEYIKE